MKKKILANCILFLTAIIWGLAFVAQVSGSESLDPFYFNAIRFSLGAVSLIPVILLLEIRPSKKASETNNSVSIESDRQKFRKTLIAAAICGTILFIASTLQQWGSQLTGSPGRAGFLTGIYNLLTPVAAMLVFKAKIKPPLFLGAGFAAVGIYLLCLRPGEGFEFGLGEVLLIVGAVFWAFHILIIDSFNGMIYALRFSAIQFAIVSLYSLIFALIFETVSFEMILQAKYALLYCGCLSVGVGFTLQVFGQRLASPSYAAIVLSLEAVFGAIGGFIFGQDKMTLPAVLGCISVFIGIILAQIEPKQKTESQKILKVNNVKIQKS